MLYQRNVMQREKDIESRIPERDRELFDRAWKLARENHGDCFTFYLPGMIRYGDVRGLYPALSLTGSRCQLQCEHCKGLLLKPMIPAPTPDALITKCLKLARSGHSGVLLSGGSDLEGRLPWGKFYRAISRIRSETSLFISVHCGFLDYGTATALKEAGVDQALIDIVGDEETAQEIYHLEGLKRVTGSLEDLFTSGLEVVPHIVAGLMYGRVQGEYEALSIINRFQPSALVIVVLNPLKGTPMATVSPLNAIAVARLIARARVMMPNTPISLGCERPRNKEGELMEALAIHAGATRMAVWSQKTVDLVLDLGLKPLYQPTCCSVPYREDFSNKLGMPA
ncbi:MAG: radical SAM protein [Deltaproteobacteria bacterium]|nr:MAG: radical SAM protein [Deltaproteobacteria bacterium]